MNKCKQIFDNQPILQKNAAHLLPRAERAVQVHAPARHVPGGVLGGEHELAVHQGGEQVGRRGPHVPGVFDSAQEGERKLRIYCV